MQLEKERDLGLQKLFREFGARGTLDGILTPVNGEFELLGKFGRCFITRVDKLRTSNNSSNNREISSSVENYFFPNFGSTI
jgi:hypothetical protein